MKKPSKDRTQKGEGFPCPCRTLDNGHFERLLGEGRVKCVGDIDLKLVGSFGKVLLN